MISSLAFVALTTKLLSIQSYFIYKASVTSQVPERSPAPHPPRAAAAAAAGKTREESGESHHGGGFDARPEERRVITYKPLIQEQMDAEDLRSV